MSGSVYLTSLIEAGAISQIAIPAKRLVLTRARGLGAEESVSRRPQVSAELGPAPQGPKLPCRSALLIASILLISAPSLASSQILGLKEPPPGSLPVGMFYQLRLDFWTTPLPPSNGPLRFGGAAYNGYLEGVVQVMPPPNKETWAKHDSLWTLLWNRGDSGQAQLSEEEVEKLYQEALSLDEAVKPVRGKISGTIRPGTAVSTSDLSDAVMTCQHRGSNQDLPITYFFGAYADSTGIYPNLEIDTIGGKKPVGEFRCDVSGPIPYHGHWENMDLTPWIHIPKTLPWTSDTTTTNTWDFMEQRNHTVARFRAECQLDAAPPPPSQIVVNTGLTEAPIDQSKSIVALTKEFAPDAEPGETLFAYTIGDPPPPKAPLETNAATASFGSRVCFWVVRLTIDWTLPVQTYIGKEFPAGGCKYKVLFKHEQKHVAAMRRVMEYYAAKADNSARRLGLPWAGRPIPVANAEEGKSLAKKRLADLLRPLYRKYKIIAKEESHAVDTDEEIRAVHRALLACGK